MTHIYNISIHRSNENKKCVITLNEAEEGGRRPGNGREEREGGGNGGPGADSTWEWREGAAQKSSTVLRQTEGGRLAGDIYLGLPRREGWRCGAAPRSMARQTLPRHRSAPRSSPCHPSRRATMHGAAQAFRCAMATAVAKSVSFEKKNKQYQF